MHEFAIIYSPGTETIMKQSPHYLFILGHHIKIFQIGKPTTDSSSTMHKIGFKQTFEFSFPLNSAVQLKMTIKSYIMTADVCQNRAIDAQLQWSMDF